jgi:hypothetical protein
MIEWIRPKDSLPKEYEHVLTYSGQMGYGVGYVIFGMSIEERKKQLEANDPKGKVFGPGDQGGMEHTRDPDLPVMGALTNNRYNYYWQVGCANLNSQDVLFWAHIPKIDDGDIDDALKHNIDIIWNNG